MCTVTGTPYYFALTRRKSCNRTSAIPDGNSLCAALGPGKNTKTLNIHVSQQNLEWGAVAPPPPHERVSSGVSMLGLGSHTHVRGHRKSTKLVYGAKQHVDGYRGKVSLVLLVPYPCRLYLVCLCLCFASFGARFLRRATCVRRGRRCHCSSIWRQYSKCFS